jgi:hypothetical protein
VQRVPFHALALIERRLVGLNRLAGSLRRRDGGVEIFHSAHHVKQFANVGLQIVQYFVFREVLKGVCVVLDGMDTRATLVITRSVPSCQAFS